MTEHYNRPPPDPGHVYIQPVAAIPGHHTITRSGGSSLIANSTSPHADAVAPLRAAGLNAPTHVIIWADSSNPIYRGELETPKREGKAGIMKLAAAHGVGVGTVQRIKAALAG